MPTASSIKNDELTEKFFKIIKIQTSVSEMLNVRPPRPRLPGHAPKAMPQQEIFRDTTRHTKHETKRVRVRVIDPSHLKGLGSKKSFSEFFKMEILVFLGFWHGDIGGQRWTTDTYIF